MLLNHQQQQHHPRGDDHERNTSARQAAEALFTPKRQPVEPSADPAPSAERPARKPRVLSILSPAPVRNEEVVVAPVNLAPRTKREIPRSHHARTEPG
jgi:hypothetical protein